MKLIALSRDWELSTLTDVKEKTIFGGLRPWRVVVNPDPVWGPNGDAAEKQYPAPKRSLIGSTSKLALGASQD